MVLQQFQISNVQILGPTTIRGSGQSKEAMHLEAIVRVDVVKEVRAIQAGRTNPVHRATVVTLTQGALAREGVVGEDAPPPRAASLSA